jgi:hypothetical protein
MDDGDGDGDGDGDRGMRGIYLPVLYPPEVSTSVPALSPFTLPNARPPSISFSTSHRCPPPRCVSCRPWQDTFPFPITLWYSPDPGHFTAVLSVRPMHPGDGSGLLPG